MSTTYSVSLNGVYENAPRDRNGAVSLVITDGPSVYLGDKAGCIAALKNLPIGTSVTTRYPGGARSCINKPALWADIETMS